MDTQYTYLFIRKDLTGPQQIVQAAHAALEAGHRFGEHSHLICFGAQDEEDLLKQARYLDQQGIKFQMFHEPDNDTGFTAICTEPLQGDQRRPMRRFSLLREAAVV